MTQDRPGPVSSRPQGSDGDGSLSEPAFLAVARVVRPHGLTGEVRAEIHTDYPERFDIYRRLYVGPEHRPQQLESYRFHQGLVLLKFRDVNDRDAAETLRDQWVWVAVQDAVPLQKGQVYMHQMLHMHVFTVEGEDLGRIDEIIESSAHLVYVVHGLKGEILIPDIESIVLEVDAAARRVTVQLMEGLR